MSQKQRLELTWVGKDEQPKLEPRILIEDPDKSYGDKSTENMLIYGDNLLALKALEQDFSGKIKCVFIDPPYNTGNAFEHYDDGVEHSIWLNLISQRLKNLRNLLSSDGSIWVTLDDNEIFYCKVIMDEIFGRSNFVADVIWQHSVQGKGYAGKFSVHHNYMLCYRKSDLFQLGLLERTAEHNVNYANPDNDPKGAWRAGDVRNALYRPNLIYEVKTPSGKTIKPPPNGWRWSKETMQSKIATGEIFFSQDEKRIVRKIYLANQEGRVPETIWFGEDVGTTREANAEIKALFPTDLFPTPKPEKLVSRVLTLCTNEGDWVLDSFLGAGTSAAVAHKMKRKWIGIELGEHCHTHCMPRLKSVIDGKDQGGISEVEKWKGGGGFRYYYLAPSLLKKDKYSNWIIDERYNSTMLAATMAKHEGFKYCPDETLYWKQGQSTEKDFILTTTGFITVEHLTKIKEEMKPDESLLICCKSFQEACVSRFPNITVKKIPNMLLGRCEFGKEDYSLNIVNMPVDDNADDDADSDPAEEADAKQAKKEVKKKTKKVTSKNQTDLFTDSK